MRFEKYHGTGNDFVFVEDLDAELDLDPSLVVAVCDRHRGVGADGLIRIVRGDVWDAGAGHGTDPAFRGGEFFMDHYNADGLTAEMCGNGIRCLAKFVRERGLTDRSEIVVGTRAGERRLALDVRDGVVRRVTVDMGAPAFERKAIPMTGEPTDTFELQPLEAAGRTYTATALSMGNPHCVLFLEPGEDLAGYDVAGVGRTIELRDDLFPSKVNVEFVQVVDDGRIRMRVWERGVGETMACGTGACAAAAACAASGRTGRRVRVDIPGGRLDIDWRDDDRVDMTGPATFVFAGELSPGWARDAGVRLPAKAGSR
ncbi:MAG TPA: diaminopimelate epimerase [Actinomycetota bacterium]